VPASASTLPAAFEQPRPLHEGEPRLARRLRFIRQYAIWRQAVRELWRFKWREHRARPMLGAYHTRERAIPYFIRHGTRDVGIFAEIFIAGEYDPPSAVAERLADLGRAPRILDLGANIGLFAASCRERWPGASVVSVEPDPENLELLRRTAADTDAIEVIAACATDHDGSVRFVAGQFAESHVADEESAEETIEVPCVDALRLAQSADLVKIDIEGSEWDLLADPRFASISAQALVMEWHEERCPHADPPAAAHAALRAAGFRVLGEHRPVASNGTVWALRSA
jgi:FkbM family methyltransferase